MIQSNIILIKGFGFFCCMLDAIISKEFDHIRSDKLFSILFDKGNPHIIIRILLDMNEKQQVRAAWNHNFSDYFTVKNGIRQSDIISPILYTIYADELIKRLQSLNVGCHIGHLYAGVICYADDTAVLIPSIKGLQKMLWVCEDFGADYDTLYNERKIKCIRFTQNKAMSEILVYLNGK